MAEQWKTIPGYPNYKVSTMGRVLATDGIKQTQVKPYEKIMAIYVLICIRMDNVAENVFTYWLQKLFLVVKRRLHSRS